MLVLALDTATPAVTAGVVELTFGPEVTAIGPCSTRVTYDTRKHAELLMPEVLGACADAAITLRDVHAVVTGTGPGPFTGLRVGMVTAAALGDALGVPVHGVCSLDAIAIGRGELLVVTDARRREVYWAAYGPDGRRTAGPAVDRPDALAARVPELGVTAVAGGVKAAELAELTGLTLIDEDAPSPVGLATAAADALRAGGSPGPLEPLYLRRPDAVEPGARKRVTV